MYIKVMKNVIPSLQSWKIGSTIIQKQIPIEVNRVMGTASN